MKNKLFAIGEALIDFIPSDTGVAFEDVRSFSPKIGGAPANVLGAFAKLGGETELITQLGDDPFGHKIKNALEKFNIGCSYVFMTSKANTALAFVSLEKNGNRTFSFYRKPSADLLLDESQIEEKWFKDCFALHFCSVSLVPSPMKKAHEKAIKLAKKSLISFDVNLRFPLWEDKKLLKETVNEFVEKTDVLKISDEEIEFVTGEKEQERAINKLLEKVKLVILTCGSNGAFAYTKKAKAFSPSVKVKAVDTTGAGDGFCGSFLYNLNKNGFTKENIEKITEDELKSFLDFSNKFCSLSVMKEGAIESYPRTEEI